MPRVFGSVDKDKLDKEIMQDYFDRHTPHVICEETTKKGEKIKVKIKLGDEYSHPDDYDHYISYVQLWNRETFLAEAHFTPGVLGNKSDHVEVDFYIVPSVSMNLTAMSNCTKHGLWKSDEKYIKVIQ